MPLDMFKILFPKATIEQLAKHKDERVILCMYQKKKSRRTQVRVYSVTIKHINKDALCRFYLV